MTTSRILDAMHESARDMFQAGLIDAKRMQEYDALCLPELQALSAEEIKKLRAKANMSQAVFAHVLNTSPSTVRHWEAGTRTPSGPSLKLLDLIQRKGVQALL